MILQKAKQTRSIIIVLSLILAVVATGLIARADEFDQAIKLTFNQPIAIPDRELPAGTYWFILPDHGNNNAENVLQVYDGDRKHVIATLNVGTEQVVKPSGHIILTMADRRPKPQALLSLTYPGREDGHLFEVSYPKQQRSGMSEYPKITMKVGENGVMESTENTKK